MNDTKSNTTCALIDGERQHAGKYLTIGLAGEAYGIAVLKVREIIRTQKITSVPQLPAHVKGVINLRGRVIPVIDLRVKFGFKAEIAERTCIVVVQVRLADSPVQVGLVVDSVDEVVTFAAEDIEPTEQIGALAAAQFVVGMAKGGGQVKMLLDIDRVVGADATAV